MCLWELWIYLKCTLSSEHGHHQVLYPVAPCSAQRTCATPPSVAELEASTPDIKIVRRNRYCPSCFEALRNTIGGCGEMCWPCGGVSVDLDQMELEWSWDDRLVLGRDLVDFMPADGSDGGILEKGKARKDNRFRAVGRSWKGWEEF